MNADILVVARDQHSLYEYLRQDFADEPEVRVVMDRRMGERRRRSEPRRDNERRAGDRRSQAPLAEKLAVVGFAVVSPSRGPVLDSAHQSRQNTS